MEPRETLQLQVCGSLCNVPNRYYWSKESLGMQPETTCRSMSRLASDVGEGPSGMAAQMHLTREKVILRLLSSGATEEYLG